MSYCVSPLHIIYAQSRKLSGVEIQETNNEPLPQKLLQKSSSQKFGEKKIPIIAPICLLF